MCFAVQFAPEVVAQLEAIEEFVTASTTGKNALEFVDAIIAHCETLRIFPLRGIRRDDVLGGLRTTHYRGNTIIAFQVDEAARVVSILGVYYGGRNLDALLGGLAGS